MSTTMLELAISMIFLYLMLSAASSANQEIIANIFRWRANTLEKGIAGLFNEEFKKEFYQLPLIESLCSPNARGTRTHKPSYIAPATFALAVLDLAAKKKISLPGAAIPQPAPPAGNPNNPVPPDGAAQNPLNATPQVDPFAKPADLLRSLLLGANTVEEQRKRLETWFNDSMDRVSGWYKRTSHAWLWIIGIVLCLLVNADSISLANAFWNDPTLRAAMVTAATEHVKNPPKSELTPSANNPSPGSKPATGSAGTNGPSSNSDEDAFKRLEKVRKELAKVNVPLGWCWEYGGGQKKCFPNLGTTTRTADADATDPRMIMPSGESDPYLWWFLKFVGILLTTLAISQGAPFWFDLLQKAVNLRLAGDVPDEKKQKK